MSVAEHTTGTAHPMEATHGEDEVFYMQAEFWVAIAFFIVVGFFARKVSSAIAVALDLRADKIRTRLEDARKLREDAQSLLADYQRRQRDAIKEAEGIVAHAREEAQRHKREAATALDEAIKRREAQAKTRIAQAEAQAMADVRNLAVDIAIGAARQLIAQNLTPDQADALIERDTADLPHLIKASSMKYVTSAPTPSRRSNDASRAS